MAAFEYQLQSQAAAIPGPLGTSLSLQVERRGTDLLVTWNRNAPAISDAKTGLLYVGDGDAAQQELRLDADALRNGSVLYTPASNKVQFRMRVSGAGGEIVNEAVVALTAPLKTSLPQQRPQPVEDLMSRRPTWYTVQVGTFRNRSNAERLRGEMEARYGQARLVSQANNPSLWRVFVGRHQTSEDARRLAQLIRADGGETPGQVLVLREIGGNSL